MREREKKKWTNCYFFTESRLLKSMLSPFKSRTLNDFVPILSNVINVYGDRLNRVLGGGVWLV